MPGKVLTICGVILINSGRLLAGEVLESLRPFLINHFTFDNPQGGDVNSPVELDLGTDKTNINLLNGAPRVTDTPWSGSKYSLETGQKNEKANDDWKAGVMFPSSSASTLVGSKHVKTVTIMGWFKPLVGAEGMPTLNTNTPAPDDRFNAIGLAGLLRGDEKMERLDGHAVRALLEVINNRVTAMGRRLDSQSASGTRASTETWDKVMPPGQWTHLACTIDFDTGAVALYKNGQPLASNPAAVNAWQLTEGEDFTSDTAAGGIKIGGSHPDNSREQNPFIGRMDELMFFKKALTAEEVAGQFKLISDASGPSTRPAGR